MTNLPGHLWRDKWTALSGPLTQALRRDAQHLGGDTPPRERASERERERARTRERERERESVRARKSESVQPGDCLIV